jgi:hypothetical protein
LLTDADALEKLKAHAQEAAKHAREKFDLPLALIVIDTVSAAAGFTDENSAAETQKVMTILRELSRATGALALAIDHYGKQTETGIRGSSAKSAAADAILACLGERDNEGNVSNHRLAVTKLRNGPTGRVIPFELRQTETEFGVTCTVEWRLTAVEAAPVDKPRAWPKSLVILKRALLNALDEFGKRLRPFADNLELVAVDREKVRAEFIRAYPADNRKAKTERFRRCEIAALERGFLGSRSIGEDLATTVFWLVRDDPRRRATAIIGNIWPHRQRLWPSWPSWPPPCWPKGASWVRGTFSPRRAPLSVPLGRPPWRGWNSAGGAGARGGWHGPRRQIFKNGMRRSLRTLPIVSGHGGELAPGLRVFGLHPVSLLGREPINARCGWLARVRVPPTAAVLLHGNETTRWARFRRFNLTEHQIG